MNILLIGGTGFIGPWVAGHLMEQGHEVAVFHRGQTNGNLPTGVRHIKGLRRHLPDYASEFREFAPEVVVDFILANEAQARVTMDVFRGMASRVVALSSGDVYRAVAIIHGLEDGPPQPVPLTEDSELRTQKPYRQEELLMLAGVFPWIGEEYDKIPVERVVLNDTQLAGTILRLPMVYGPGDPLHRLYPYIQRMRDGRRAILIQKDAAGWRAPRGYVENVAAAIALAAVSYNAAGRIYNIADAETFSEAEWIKSIARVAGWTGAIVPVPKEQIPEHLRVPFDSKQHWTMSSERIRSELGFWEPVPIDPAIERSIAWERANRPRRDPKQFDYAAEDQALEAIGYRNSN